MQETFQTVGRSCLWASAIFLLAYLSTAPTIHEHTEVEHWKRYDNMVDPLLQEMELEAIVAEIKLDQSLLTKWKNEIASENQDHQKNKL